ncbi:MAG TPA: VWA domain-containing protein [Spirochaetota bacterium]|nr:VWA domain-containing protein [Spirochaetota bacterium]
MEIYFANEQISWLFLIIPIILAFDIYVYFQKRKRLHRVFNRQSVSKLLPSFSPAARRAKKIFFYIALILFILALMQPKWGKNIIKVEQKGIDIMFLIDVSNSMTAEDIKPNRLAKARMQIASFLEKLKGDRVGLSAFAGSTFTLCPLTADYKAVRLFLDHLNPGIIRRQGTRIGTALKNARERFKRYNSKSKAVILLTDGEDHGTMPLVEAEHCRQDDIIIFCIGLGKREGEPIPVKEKGTTVDYLKDKHGKVVMSKLDEFTLQQIAEKTGGEYYYSQFGDFELEHIYNQLQSMEKEKLGVKSIENYKNRYHIFILLGIIFFLFSVFLPERKSVLWSRIKDRVKNKLQEKVNEN